MHIEIVISDLMSMRSASAFLPMVKLAIYHFILFKIFEWNKNTSNLEWTKNIPTPWAHSTQIIILNFAVYYCTIFYFSSQQKKTNTYFQSKCIVGAKADPLCTQWPWVALGVGSDRPAPAAAVRWFPGAHLHPIRPTHRWLQRSCILNHLRIVKNS